MAWSITIDRAYFTSESPEENETYSKKYLNLKGFKLTSNYNQTVMDDEMWIGLYGIQVIPQPYSISFNKGTSSFSNNLPYHSSDYDADTDYMFLGNKFGNNSSPNNGNKVAVSVLSGVKTDLKIDLDPLLVDNYYSNSNGTGSDTNGYSGLYRGHSGYGTLPEDDFKVANFTKAGDSGKSVTSLYIPNNSGVSIGSSTGYLMDSSNAAMVKARNSWKLARSLSSLSVAIGMNQTAMYLGTDPDSFSGVATKDAPDQVIYPYSSGDELVTTSGNGPKMWTNSGGASGDPHITTFGGDRYTL